MKENHRLPTHEMMHIGVLLAFVGGFLDAYTYILHGGVFANAQTGNIVLLGIHMFQGNFHKILFYLIPILAFSLGILTSEYFRRKNKVLKIIPWRRSIILLEALLLTFLYLLPKDMPDIFINSSISYIAALQMNSFRRVLDLPYATTMCTGNLRSSMELVSRYLFDKDKEGLGKAIRYFIIILCFFSGAGIGALLSTYIGRNAIMICVVILLLTEMVVSRLKQANV